MSWRDRAIGIILGLVIGIAIITLFVFLGSEQTIDAPSVDDDRPPAERSQDRGRR